MCLQEKVWGWYSIPLFRRRLGNFKLLLLDYFSTILFVYYCIQSRWGKSRIISSWIIFLASSWQLYTFKCNKLHNLHTHAWGCILEYVSKSSFIWSLFGTIPTLWRYARPYFNFHGTFSRGLILWVVAWENTQKMSILNILFLIFECN